MRTLLVPLAESTGVESVLGVAFLLTRAFDAHLTGLFVRPDPRAAIPFMGEGLTADAIQDLVDAAERDSKAKASRTQAIFEDRMKAAELTPGDGLSETTRPSVSWEETVGMISDRVGRAARLADLTVVPQPGAPNAEHAGELFNEVLFRSGRPLMLAPPEAPAAVGDNILVAWNGRAECARTVAAALPLLKRARRIELLTVDEEHPDRPSLEALRLYLARHGVEAQMIRRKSGSRSVGETLIETTEETGADLVVMGAFSHSRWREMIIGGVTRHALNNSAVPVFMSH